MKIKKLSDKMNAVHVISKDNKVFIKSETNEWYPINFQWIPIVKLNKIMNS
tara:strand:- start:21836 stop:21988 length:153 start_codon:yes stop_codon:yes gene_type:complete